MFQKAKQAEAESMQKRAAPNEAAFESEARPETKDPGMSQPAEDPLPACIEFRDDGEY